MKNSVKSVAGKGKAMKKMNVFLTNVIPPDFSLIPKKVLFYNSSNYPLPGNQASYNSVDD